MDLEEIFAGLESGFSAVFLFNMRLARDFTFLFSCSECPDSQNVCLGTAPWNGRPKGGWRESFAVDPLYGTTHGYVLCRGYYISISLGFPSHLLEPLCPCLRPSVLACGPGREGSSSGRRPRWPWASHHAGPRRTRRPEPAAY